MYIKSFKELIVWQKAVELAKEVYARTSEFPPRELFGLQSQMCRSAVSIPSNIAEGHRRNTKKDFLYFLRIADGSAAELETQILIAESAHKRINYDKSKELLLEVQKMLSTVIKKLELNANR